MKQRTNNTTHYPPIDLIALRKALETDCSCTDGRIYPGLPDGIWALRTPVSMAADRANEHVVAWARRHGLVRSEAAERRLASVRLGDFAARVYPTAAVEDLLLATDWIAWLDFLDDQNDDRRTALDPQGLDGFLARVADVASTGACDAGTGPIGDGLTDLWARTGPGPAAGCATASICIWWNTSPATFSRPPIEGLATFATSPSTEYFAGPRGESS